MGEINIELVLVILASVCVLAVILQGIAILQTSKAVRSLVQRIDRQSKSLEKDVRDLADKMHEITDNLQPLGEISETLKADVDEISDMLKKRSQDIDDFAEEVVRVGRGQAGKIDMVVTDTVEKFERTTTIIQRDLLRPALEIAAFLKGLRSGLNYLFSHKERPAKQEMPEEELFI